MPVVELKNFYSNFPAPIDGVVNPDVGHFNVFNIEDILSPVGKRPTYSRRSFYKVSLVVGHSKIHYADQCIEVNGSALVFTNPQVPYFWERITEMQSGYLCVFTEDFFNRFGNIKAYPVFQNASNAIIPLDHVQAEEFKTLFIRIISEIKGDYLYKYDLIRNLLMELIHSAQKLHPASGTKNSGSNAAERITYVFKELLERQFPIELNNQVMQLKSASEFADQLSIHVNHLNKAVKEITGKTTSQLIAERMVQEAKILLKSTDWNVSEIGWSLGFKESNHFSAFFKLQTKITAAQYRKSAVD